MPLSPSPSAPPQPDPLFSSLSPSDLPWLEREFHRALSAPITFMAEPIFQSHKSLWGHHYPHTSPSDPAFITYTPSIAYGRLDRRVRISPGRYLAKYFSHLLTPKQIKFYAEWHSRQAKPGPSIPIPPLQFARTADHIALLYSGPGIGPLPHGLYSCMDGRCFPPESNPTRAYAGGDLSVAFIEAPTALAPSAPRLVARAVVWEERKLFSRIYPTADYWRSDQFISQSEAEEFRQILFAQLKAAGFSHTSEADEDFSGARLSKIPFVLPPNFDPDDDEIPDDPDHLFAMPYIDGMDYFSPTPDGFLTLSRNGFRSCTETCGYTIIEPPPIPVPCALCATPTVPADLSSVYQDDPARTHPGPAARLEVCSQCYDRSLFCNYSANRFVPGTPMLPSGNQRQFRASVVRRRPTNFFQSQVSGLWFSRVNSVPVTNTDGLLCTREELVEARRLPPAPLPLFVTNPNDEIPF